MKSLKRGGRTGRSIVSLMVVALLSGFGAAAAPQEQSFALIQIGARAYKNVTVTTRAKSYIMLLHSEGITSVKVADLSPEVRQQLGYEEPKPKATAASSVNAWAKQTMAKVETPQVKAIEQGILKHSFSAMALVGDSPKDLWRVLAVLLSVGAGVYLFFCYCYSQICRKTGTEPGPLVWLPVLQIIPLLRAASMSPWWLLGFLVPGLNLVGHILWSVNITKARGKGGLTALVLLLPVTTFLGVLYLAFSDEGARKKQPARPKIEIMTLETA